MILLFSVLFLFLVFPFVFFEYLAITQPGPEIIPAHSSTVARTKVRCQPTEICTGSL